MLAPVMTAPASLARNQGQVHKASTPRQGQPMAQDRLSLPKAPQEQVKAPLTQDDLAMAYVQATSLTMMAGMVGGFGLMWAGVGYGPLAYAAISGLLGLGVVSGVALMVAPLGLFLVGKALGVEAPAK